MHRGWGSRKAGGGQVGGAGGSKAGGGSDFNPPGGVWRVGPNTTYRVLKSHDMGNITD